MDVSQTNSQNQKTQRTLQGPDIMFREDMISKLDDSLLSHILSFMSTKSAVRTSVLSKRWKNVWKSVPKLHLKSKNFADKDEFMDFVDKSLAFHHGLCLKKFRVKYDLEEDDKYRFGQWFKSLTDCNVEHVNLINGIEECLLVVPSTLCYCNTLVVLELNFVSLEVPEFISLPHLKILNIHVVGFRDADTFRALISCCPVLEEAYITHNHWDNHWDNLDVYIVSSKSLKKLCIFNMDVDFFTHESVLIDAPSLEYLCLAGEPFDILTTKVSDALIEADLHVVTRSAVYNIDFQENVNNLSLAIWGARSLTLSAATLNIFATYQLLPAFAKLRYLDAEFEETTWELLQALVANSPNLQTLIVGRASALPGHFKLSIPNDPLCLFSSLQFFELRGYVTGRSVEKNLVKYFLKYSSLLKKVTIRIHNKFQMQRKKLHSFLEELETFQTQFHGLCQIVAVEDKSRTMSPTYRDGKFSVWDE